MIESVYKSSARTLDKTRCRQRSDHQGTKAGIIGASCAVACTMGPNLDTDMVLVLVQAI